MTEERLTLIEHLQELKIRLIKSILFILIAGVVVYAFIDNIFPHLVRPVGKLVFIAPQEAFISNIKIAFFGGLLLSSPFVIFQLWQFIKTGLRSKEKKYTLIFCPLSFIFFLAGAAFGYFIIVPIGVNFLLGFANDLMVPMITVSRYISFLGILTLTFGVIFELPLAALFLTKLGLVTPKFLSSKRKEALISVFIVAAILTFMLCAPITPHVHTIYHCLPCYRVTLRTNILHSTS